MFWGRATFGLTVFFQPKLKNFPVWILYKKQPSEFRWLLYSSQNIYEEVLTKHIRRSHDKTFTMKSWQNIYEEVMTNHLRRSHDKTYTKKSWQNIYDEVYEHNNISNQEPNSCDFHMESLLSVFRGKQSYEIIYTHYDEVMTKHLRWSHDKTYTKKFWQNIYDEVMTKHLRWSHDKTFTFMFDKAYTMKFRQNIYVHVWQSIYDEVLTKHIRRSLDKAYTLITMKKSWKFNEVRKEVRSHLFT